MVSLDLMTATENLRCERCNKDPLGCICTLEDRITRLLDFPSISDEAMQVYRNEGSLDFYRLVAYQIFGVGYSQATDEQCSMARRFYLAQVQLLAK